MLFCQWSQNIVLNPALAGLPGRPFDLGGSSCRSATAGYLNSFKAESKTPESEASESVAVLEPESEARGKGAATTVKGFWWLLTNPLRRHVSQEESDKSNLCAQICQHLLFFLCRGCETGCWAERVLLFVGLILIVSLLSAFDERKQEIAQAKIRLMQDRVPVDPVKP